MSGLQRSAGSLRDLTHSVPDLPLSHVGTVTNVRTEKAKVCQVFLRNGRDPCRKPWAAKAGLKWRFVQAAPERAALQKRQGSAGLALCSGNQRLQQAGNTKYDRANLSLVKKVKVSS